VSLLRKQTKKILRVKILVSSEKLTINLLKKEKFALKWGTEDLPTQTHWVDTVGEIHMMERLTHRLRLTESQMDSKWRKWTLWQLTQN